MYYFSSRAIARTLVCLVGLFGVFFLQQNGIYAEEMIANVATGSNECKTVPFVKLPQEFGLDTCVGNNVGPLLEILAKTQLKCSVFKVVKASKSKTLQKVANLVRSMVANPAAISSLFYEHMQTTPESEINKFCDDYSDIISPCAEALVPKLIELIHTDQKCCGQLSDALDILSLIVPGSSSKEAFLLNQVVNGLNGFFCARRGDTKKTCGFSMFSQFLSSSSKQEFRILNTFLLPFVTIPESQTCDAFQGKNYTNTASNQIQKTIDYSCCIDYIRPVMTSITQAIDYLLAITPVDFLNGIVEFEKGLLNFVDSIQFTKKTKCIFDGQCIAPKYMIKRFEKKPFGSSMFFSFQQNRNTLENTKCTKSQKCDSTNQVCSEICQKGTVIVPKWLHKTISYQRQLAYQGPICYMQIPATHNTAINLADGYGNRDQVFNANLNSSKSYSFLKTNNQILSLTDQLNMGVRFLEIDTHFFLDDFHSAHCGNLGSQSVDVFFQVILEQLSKYGKILWGPELLGCFPSLSGIRSNEQLKTRDTLKEIANWLEKKENQNDFLIVYLDQGSEIKRLGKLKELNKLVEEIFGPRLVQQKEIEDIFQNNWYHPNASVATLMKTTNKNVLLMANQDTGLAYDLRKFCTRHQILDTKYAKQFPNTNLQLGGKQLYDGTFVRSYEAVLRYVSLDQGGRFSQQMATLLNKDNIGSLVRWNVNLIAPDSLDMTMIRAMTWSWAENEPKFTSENAFAYISVTGRWLTSETLPKKRKACLNATSRKWKIVEFTSECPQDFGFTYPKDPYQNYLLQVEILLNSIVDPVVIDAPLQLE